MRPEDSPTPEALAAAVRLHQAGDWNSAKAAYRQILHRDPDHAGALHLLGVLAHQRGEGAQAVDLIAQSLAREPGRAAVHNNYGVALRGLGRLEEAVAAYREALRLRPDYADAWSNLGAALHAGGRPDEARPPLEAALRLRPDHLDALYNLGNVLHELGDAEGAVGYYQRTHQLAPRRADVLNNWGNALLALGRLDEAVGVYRRALSFAPQNADIHANLGAALERQDRVAEAADSYAVAARLRPHESHWPVRIAALCPAVFPDAEAIDRYRAGLEAVLDAHRGGVHLAPETVAVSGCPPPSFPLAHHGRDDLPLKAKFAAVFRVDFPARHITANTGRFRIGFLVTTGHEGGFLRGTAGIIDGLTPARFQPVVFVATRRLATVRSSLSHPEVEYVPLPDHFPTAIERVAAARCDVLYHWQIGTDALNYFLPFTRVAPVQCTSWGTHGTSGIPEVDYYLSSDLIEPPGAEAHYSEELVRLATLPTYQRRPIRPDPPGRRSEFGLPEGVNLYACLQRPLKFHPDFDALLAGVLRRDPRGLILIREGRPGPAAAQLWARFQATMTEVANRIVLLPDRNPGDYYRLLSLADVTLDPVPFGVGLTAYDIFGLGLPLVTLPGRFAVGRFGLACYRKMGLHDLVAESPEHYVELAVRLGTDHAYRAGAAARIAAASPALFEDDGAVREHEQFFAWAAERARHRVRG